MPLAFHLMICKRTDPEHSEPDDRIYPQRKGPKAEGENKNLQPAANQGFRVFEPVKTWEKSFSNSLKQRCCPPQPVNCCLRYDL